MEAALARNPSDVDAHLALAQLKLERRDLMAVWNETRRVLELAPGNPMGLAYEGFVRIAMGQPDVAAEVLRKSIAADPAFIDAHAWLALAYARMGRRQDAQATVAAASQRFPDRAEEFRRFLAAVDRDSAAETAASDEADPHLILKRARLYVALAGGVEAAHERIAGYQPIW